MCIPKNEYGSVEYYKNYFSDIIGDAGDDDDNFARADAIMEGFNLAIEDWMKWHRNAAKNFQHLQDRLLYARNASMME
tara:strand:- start:423 stop:656 length:234 start_codon:yes stop_codon:yes gene_type:complete